MGAADVVAARNSAAQLSVRQPKPNTAARFKVIRDRAAKMMGAGMSLEDIADILGMTLRQIAEAFYAAELPAPMTESEMEGRDTDLLLPDLPDEQAIALMYAGQRYEDALFKPKQSLRWRGSPERQPWTGSSLTWLL